jgi:hypothetical protein
MQANATASVSSPTGTVMLCSEGGAPALARETRHLSASIRVYGSCVKGFMAGLCMEGALALCLYGIYHLGHILH